MCSPTSLISPYSILVQLSAGLLGWLRELSCFAHVLQSNMAYCGHIRQERIESPYLHWSMTAAGGHFSRQMQADDAKARQSHPGICKQGSKVIGLLLWVFIEHDSPTCQTTRKNLIYAQHHCDIISMYNIYIYIIYTCIIRYVCISASHVYVYNYMIHM